MLTVWSHAAWSNWPMPFGDGQISPLISFIIQSWWLLPSVEPALVRMSAHLSGLSRQYIQPRYEAFRNLTANSFLPGVLRHESQAATPSWSMAVPLDGSLKQMPLRSAG